MNLKIINHLKPKKLGSGAKTVVGTDPKETNIRNKNYGKSVSTRKASSSAEKSWYEKGLEIVGLD